MKKASLTIVLILISVCLYAQNLSWDINFLTGSEQTSTPISQIIRMETGDVFQFSIKSDTDAFCYIICYDSKRDILVLHNGRLTGGGENLFGPFNVEDPSGAETIYIIMSLENLPDLEGLIQNFNRAKTRQSTNSLYRAVVNLQNRVSRLGEPKSAFIPIGGTSRSSSQQYVTRFSGSGLYVRAITIRH